MDKNDFPRPTWQNTKKRETIKKHYSKSGHRFKSWSRNTMNRKIIWYLFCHNCGKYIQLDDGTMELIETFPEECRREIAT